MVLNKSTIHVSTSCRLENSSNTFDIIPGKYEGGLKIWECSIDLACAILSDNVEVKAGPILEIGCGHAIPGITALLKSGTQNSMILIDFNIDVIMHVTWPNIIKNCADYANVKCFAGDMSDFSSNLRNGLLDVPMKYALIVTSETLYNANVSNKVFEVIENHLSDSGVAVIASKRYYFGVGGGTHDFLKACESSTSTLECFKKMEFEDGISNVRELLFIRKR